MAMKRATLSMLLFAGVDAVKVSSEMTTPAQTKVVKMLEKLQEEVAAEAQTEMKQFEEFAAFCRRNTDEKQYQIGKATTKIERLTANTDALTTELTELETKIKENQEAIQTYKEDLTKTQEDREAEVAEYQANAKEMNEAIDALGRAITTLKSSKDKVTALPQLATQLLDTVSKVKLQQLDASHLEMLSSVAGVPGKAATYEHKAGDVISMLGGLLTTFKANKQTLDMAEGEADGSFQKKQLNINNQIKNAEAELDQQKMTEAEKKAKHGEQSTELTKTQQAKAADEEFLKSLTDDCAAKAEIGAQRKQSRAEEQVAIKAAVTALKDQGVGGSFLQLGSRSQYRSPAVRHASVAVSEMKRHLRVMEANMDAAEVMQANGRSIAFLQVNKKVAEPTAQAKMEALFRRVEATNDSPAVSLAILQAKKSGATGPDAMAGVRKIIQELIANMEKAAENDSSQRDFCLGAVGKHTENRDNYNAELEQLNTDISAGEAKKNQDTRAVAQLQTEISDATKALDEATSLRAEDKATNDADLKEAKEGKVAVDFAVTTLKNYYEKAFIQLRTTVQAGQPEVPTAEYSGSTKGKGGVLQMLDVVASDFQREIDTIPKEEEEAQKKFEDYKAAAEEDIKSKEDEATATGAAIAELSSKLVELQSAQQTATSSLELTNAELEKLKGMCGADSNKAYGDKRAKRAEEIKKLEETMQVIQAMMHEAENR